MSTITANKIAEILAIDSSFVNKILKKINAEPVLIIKQERHFDFSVLHAVKKYRSRNKVDLSKIDKSALYTSKQASEILNIKREAFRCRVNSLGIVATKFHRDVQSYFDYYQLELINKFEKKSVKKTEPEFIILESKMNYL